MYIEYNQHDFQRRRNLEMVACLIYLDLVSLKMFGIKIHPSGNPRTGTKPVFWTDGLIKNHSKFLNMDSTCFLISVERFSDSPPESNRNCVHQNMLVYICLFYQLLSA